jgi:hypothetical protein
LGKWRLGSLKICTESQSSHQRRSVNRLHMQVALLPVSPVSLEEEPIVLVKLRLVTCADLAACLHLPRFGGESRSECVGTKC